MNKSKIEKRQDGAADDISTKPKLQRQAKLLATPMLAAALVEMSNFIGVKCPKKADWNFVMSVVEKIENIIEHKIDIHNSIQIVWWYSPKKTGTFPKGAGGGGGETVKRTPFESIFGKYYTIDCYYYDEIKFKTKPNEVAKNKMDAVCVCCCRFIQWYNEKVLPKR